jgi:hypothetical protein
VERKFRVPDGKRLQTITLVRRQSLKFDCKVGGTLWIDQVSIRSEGA